VQANGQCFFVSRELLVRTGAIAEARDSRSEDVTIARTLARAGTPVGFYEAADLVTVRMYDGWRETLQGWPRSLPMLDRHAPLAGWFGLVEVLFVQALPPWFAAAVWWNGIDGTPGQRAFLDVQAALVLMRFGVLAGMRRAYERPPLGYWLSPLLDLPVALVLIASALRRRHTWRGRTLVRERPR
jgi:dolichol-phosphate mannosyltransferase